MGCSLSGKTSGTALIRVRYKWCNTPTVDCCHVEGSSNARVVIIGLDSGGLLVRLVI